MKYSPAKEMIKQYIGRLKQKIKAISCRHALSVYSIDCEAKPMSEHGYAALRVFITCDKECGYSLFVGYPKDSQ